MKGEINGSQFTAQIVHDRMESWCMRFQNFFLSAKECYTGLVEGVDD